jgi:hypothetical protein
MARVLYTAEATVTGGRASGHGRTNDGALDVQLRSPKEMGGEGAARTPNSSSRWVLLPASRALSVWWLAASASR